MNTYTPSWAKVWREGFLPQFTRAGLQSLADALRRDDQRLLQGATTQPPPLQCLADFPVEACCAVSWVGWAGEQLDTVGEVESWFTAACIQCDQALGEPGACRWFIERWDTTERETARRELLAEVEAALAQTPEAA